VVHITSLQYAASFLCDESVAAFHVAEYERGLEGSEPSQHYMILSDNSARRFESRAFCRRFQRRG